MVAPPTIKQIDQRYNLVLSNKVIYDGGTNSIRACKSSHCKQALVAKMINYHEPDLVQMLEREAQYATKIVHANIVKFHGTIAHNDAPVLIYDRFKYNLDDAIHACRRPSKEKRIQMCIDLLDAVAWMHALDTCHTAITTKHVLVKTSYPWIIRVPYAEQCLITNLAHAHTPMTPFQAKQDMIALTHIICCIMYWDKITAPHPDWLDTFHSKNDRAVAFMQAVSNYDSFASAVDWARECKRSVDTH